MAVITPKDDEPVVLVVGSMPDEIRRTGNLETAEVVNEDYRGIWFGARHGHDPVLALALVSLQDQQTWIWQVNCPSADALATIPDDRHLVAVIPNNAPGVDSFGSDDAAAGASIVHATIVEVRHHSRTLGNLFMARIEGVEALVDLGDSTAVEAVTAPARSRAARATGEWLGDNQLVPLAWRPWHYALVDPEYISGLLWTWPLVQVYFELSNPARSAVDQLDSPNGQVITALRTYLGLVKRLARSIGVNSTGSVKVQWTRETGEEVVESEAPHDDALTAILSLLRQVFDPNEGTSGFTRVLNHLSRASHAAGQEELVAEMRTWKRAHAELCRTHLRALQVELAEETPDEEMGGRVRAPLFEAPEISPKELIEAFMYGGALHRDESRAAQIEAWDQDPALGPLMRQEVLGDVRAFVHFYGAFAGYVAKWLERVPNADDKEMAA